MQGPVNMPAVGEIVGSLAALDALPVGTVLWSGIPTINQAAPDDLPRSWRRVTVDRWDYFIRGNLQKGSSIASQERVRQNLTNWAIHSIGAADRNNYVIREEDEL